MEPDAAGLRGEVPFAGKGAAATMEVAAAGATEASETALSIAVSAGATASVTEVVTAAALSVVATLSVTEERALATSGVSAAAEATAEVASDAAAGAKSSLAWESQRSIETRELTLFDGLLLVVRSGDLVKLGSAVNASGESRNSESNDVGRGAHID